MYNGQKLSLASALTVYDTTPVINSIQQDPPGANGSFYVTLTGSNFGPVPGSVAPCLHATGSPAPLCGNTPTGDLVITQPSPYWQQPPPGAPQAFWSDTQVKVFVTPSANTSGTYDLVIESIGVYSPGLGINPSFLAKPGTNAQAESNRKSVTVSGPPTISGYAGIWWLGAAPYNDNCDPNNPKPDANQVPQNPCYYNATKLTVTPGPGGTAPTANSPANWTLTDPATGRPPTFATKECAGGAPCGQLVITATAQPGYCDPTGNVQVRVTLGGVTSAAFNVVIDWPQSTIVTGTNDVGARDLPKVGYVSTNTLRLASGCQNNMFYIAWHEEFPTDASGNTAPFHACNSLLVNGQPAPSQGWTAPIPQANWAGGTTGADGTLKPDDPDMVFDGIAYLCAGCSPDAATPGTLVGQPLNMTANAWSYQFIFVGSKDIQSLGKYWTTAPNKQVRYTDHGKDELGTWSCQ